MSEPKPAEREQHPRDRKRDTRLVLTGVAAVLLIWFALANLKSVQINFWVFTTRKPLIVVILISGLLGAAIALLATRRRHRKTEGEPVK